MAYKLNIVSIHDFLRLDPRGKFNFEESRQALMTLARECVESGVSCALLDVRAADHVRTELSMAEVYLLAKAFLEVGFPKSHRLAILHRYHAGERAEFFAATVNDEGWNVKAFESFEEAMEWFGTESEVE